MIWYILFVKIFVIVVINMKEKERKAYMELMDAFGVGEKGGESSVLDSFVTEGFDEFAQSVKKAHYYCSALNVEIFKESINQGGLPYVCASNVKQSLNDASNMSSGLRDEFSNQRSNNGRIMDAISKFREASVDFEDDYMFQTTNALLETYETEFELRDDLMHRVERVMDDVDDMTKTGVFDSSIVKTIDRMFDGGNSLKKSVVKHSRRYSAKIDSADSVLFNDTCDLDTIGYKGLDRGLDCAQDLKNNFEEILAKVNVKKSYNKDTSYIDASGNLSQEKMAMEADLDSLGFGE